MSIISRLLSNLDVNNYFQFNIRGQFNRKDRLCHHSNGIHLSVLFILSASDASVKNSIDLLFSKHCDWKITFTVENTSKHNMRCVIQFLTAERTLYKNRNCIWRLWLSSYYIRWFGDRFPQKKKKLPKIWWISDLHVLEDQTWQHQEQESCESDKWCHFCGW